MGRCFFVLFGALCAFSLPAAEATNQWYLRGPEGGFAYRVSIDSSGHVMAGGIAGLFRYDTGTSAWDYKNAGMPSPIIGDIAQTNGATFVNSDGYLARSTNGGDTWTNLSGGLVTGGQLRSIATTPAAPLVVFAAGNPLGVLRSDNLGATWQQVIPSGAQIEMMRVSPTNPNLWFVAPSAAAADSPGAGQLFRTPDGGSTATSIASGGTPGFPMEFVDVAQDPFDANHVVALAAPTADAFTDKSAGGEVWISNDAGQTWSPPNTNVFVIAPETIGGGEPRAVLFDRFTPNVVYAATTWGVFKFSGSGPVLSSTGMRRMGLRFGPGSAQPYDEVTRLAQANDGKLYASTSSGGIYVSSDGAATWSPQNAGYNGINVRMLAFQPGATGVVLAGSADPSSLGAIYRSTDFGKTWAISSTGLNASVIRGLAFAPGTPSVVIAAGFVQGNVGGEPSQGLWRSEDAGVTWAKISSNGLKFTNKRIVVFDPLDPNRVLASSPTAMNVSTDGGVTWINSKDNPTDPGHPMGYFAGLPTQVPGNSASILGLAAGPGPVSGTRFYAAVDGGPFPSSPPPGGAGGVYYSDDGGFHWTVATGLPDDSASYFSVAPTAGTLFVAKVINGTTRQGGVFKSTDFGAHWSDVSGNLPCRDIFTVASDPNTSQTVWTACKYSDISQPGGIFRSSDGGANWVPYGRGLRNPGIEWLTPDPSDHNHLLAGGLEGIQEIHFAQDTDEDGIPDADESVFGDTPGDANNDGNADSGQAFVATSAVPVGPLAPASISATTSVGDYVVVEIDQVAARVGSCASVSGLELIPTDQIPLSNRMVQSAPTIRFILPDCESATVNVRYSAVGSYAIGVFGSYSPKTPGDATTQAWGNFAASSAGVDNNGKWSLKLDQNSYGNVYAPGTGAILFQGAPGNDSIFGNGFDPP